MMAIPLNIIAVTVGAMRRMQGILDRNLQRISPPPHNSNINMIVQRTQKAEILETGKIYMTVLEARDQRTQLIEINPRRKKLPWILRKNREIDLPMSL